MVGNSVIVAITYGSKTRAGTGRERGRERGREGERERGREGERERREEGERGREGDLPRPSFPKPTAAQASLRPGKNKQHTTINNCKQINNKE